MRGVREVGRIGERKRKVSQKKNLRERGEMSLLLLGERREGGRMKVGEVSDSYVSQVLRFSLKRTGVVIRTVSRRGSTKGIFP